MSLHAKLRRSLFIALVALPLPLLNATEDCVEETRDCIPVDTWAVSLGVGLGARSNPLEDGEPLPLVLLPSVHYYGERFFIDNLNIGYLLAQSRHQEFNVLMSPAYEHMFFNDFSIGNLVIGGGVNSAPLMAQTVQPEQADSLLGEEADGVRQLEQSPASPAPPSTDDLHDRNLAMLAGFEYRAFSGPTYVTIQALQDISGVHKGQEVRASVLHDFVYARHWLSVSGGFIWQDARALDYYYGIRADEVDDPRLVYEADAGVSPFVRGDWHYRLTERWSLQATLHWRWLSDSATDSPLVAEDDVVTGFFGGVYHF